MAATDPATTRPDHALGCLGQVLSDPRRQRTLDALDASDAGRVGLETLAGAVAAREFDDDSGHADRVANALHHVHLPKLEELDLLDYDRATREVTPNDCRIATLREAASRAASALGGGVR
ncbi:hypothetical protein ACFO0N_12845 [Halobium salinum]|uniref:DUF7344 domain-containing protein n=1 Tax=Halobium salinum TaxID=1364940 RepID=A0ABD5PD18_9EURY|nr:hypothetical protein [Halobium salinum]